MWLFISRLWLLAPHERLINCLQTEAIKVYFWLCNLFLRVMLCLAVVHQNPLLQAWLFCYIMLYSFIASWWLFHRSLTLHTDSKKFRLMCSRYKTGNCMCLNGTLVVQQICHHIPGGAQFLTYEGGKSKNIISIQWHPNLLVYRMFSLILTCFCCCFWFCFVLRWGFFVVCFVF